jgi:hypothetical protein
MAAPPIAAPLMAAPLMTAPLMTAPLMAAPLLASALLCLGLATPARALTIIVNYDTSVTNLGNTGSVTTGDVETAFDTVATAFGSALSNTGTITVGVGWGEVNGSALPAGDISLSKNNITGPYPFAANPGTVSLSSLLSGTGAVLPSSNPAGNAKYYIPDAQAVGLGLTVAPPASPILSSTELAPGTLVACHCDSYIGFSSASHFSFGTTVAQAGRSIASGTYDFIGAAEHEMEEVLGRTSALNASTAYASPLDAFRYTQVVQNGTTVVTSSFTQAATTGVYASIDGGTTALGLLNNASANGDYNDWAVPNPNTNTDAQGASMPTGTPVGLSISDQDLLGALGWSFNPAATAPLFSAANQPLGAAASVIASSGTVATPEPATLAVFAAALAALPLTRRRRT